jgi:hypothetical protein
MIDTSPTIFIRESPHIVRRGKTVLITHFQQEVDAEDVSLMLTVYVV